MVEQHAPPLVEAVLPRMVVDDLAATVEFLRTVFGAVGDAPVGRPARLRLGGTDVLVSAAGERDPFPAFLYVYVADVDLVYQRALIAGADCVEEPDDTDYGERRATVRDPAGNVFQVAGRTS